MNLRYYSMISAISALAVGGALLAPSKAYAQSSGAEELTRGPVHEAFAESVSYDPEPGILVKTSPPRLIEEIPPDQRPDGDNVAWIPGYWGWDEEQSDFIWISGIWRNVPPGRQWVPGYWGEDGSQWQWTSGYWATEDNQEVTYYSKPPKSLETGPTAAAPSDDYIWVSGSWINREDRYAWRPGYWEPAQENWTWMPAHYQWTRRGYVFVDGYWDYNVPRRGTVFAPVRFDRDVYSRPDYYYTPSTVIVLNVFLNHLFVRPSYNHYYFGDYYAPRYRNEGYYSPFAYNAGRRGYDPIYAKERWFHRNDRDWERNRRADFDFYRDNEDARPPRTWALMKTRAEGDRKGRRDNFEFAQPLDRYVSNRDTRQKFVSVDKGERDKIVTERQQIREFSKNRERLEDGKRDKSEKKDGKDIVSREKFSKSPVIGKRPDQLSGNDAPPKRPEGREGKDKDDNSKNGKGRDAILPDGIGREGQGKDNKDGRGNMDPSKKDKNADPADSKKSDREAIREGKDTPLPARGGDNDKKDRNPDSDRSGKDKKSKQEPKVMGEQEVPKQTKAERKAGQSPAENVEPKQQRQPEPEKKIQRQAEPEKQRQAEPRQQRQPEPEKKIQRQAEPEKQRQAEPRQQRQPEPEKKIQRQAEPEKQRQAEPRQQRQPEPEKKIQRQAEPKQQRQTDQPKKENKKQDKEPANDGGR